MKVLYCEGLDCDDVDEPLRKQDYQVQNGHNICWGCIDREREEEEWMNANRQDMIEAGWY